MANYLIQKYTELASKAGVLSKDTLRAQEEYRKVVARENHITNIESLGKNLSYPPRIKEDILVFFEYQAKGDANLPYWDRHPLVLINKTNMDGWEGFNLHYLHPNIRSRLLYGIKQGTKLEDSQHKALQFAHKRYLASQVTVRPRLVKEDLYDVVIQMPFENFVRANAQQVWRETTRSMNRKKK